MTEPSSNPVEIPHAPQFERPILHGEKDATLRLERYDVEAGDDIVLCSADTGEKWALAEVIYTFTSRASTAYQVLERLNARHTLTETDRSVVEVLDPHYDEPVQHSDIVQGIRWEIIQRFAAVPEEDPA